ncbi:MAG: YfcC family protein, partial [Fusobacteriaceae bacterium]
ASLPGYLQAVGMFMMQLLINGLITSGSGQAAVTMPIMLPVADMINMTKQTAVLAFNFGDGFSNYVLPTSSALMGFLAVANIPYDRWMRFMWKLFLIWIVTGSILIVIANATNYGPF